MITLTVNGTAVEYDGDPSMPLLWFLRDVKGLTGTKFGCGIAQCGACTVHLNGEPRRSCVTPMAMLDGADVVTIE
jgi:isoquinoline 1-oxidoreductase subunit alpha